MTGRPTICTPELIKEIAGYICDGLSNQDAAALAGIGESTFYNWLLRGQNELDRVAAGQGRKVLKNEQPFVDFLEAIKKAQPQRKQTLLKTIKIASTAQWQAAAWLLERLHPDEFGQRVKVETWEDEAVRLIRNGQLDYKPLVDEVGADLATRLFKQAGVSVVTTDADQAGGG